jgi:hypothetical protein
LELLVCSYATNFDGELDAQVKNWSVEMLIVDCEDIPRFRKAWWRQVTFLRGLKIFRNSKFTKTG